MSLNSTSVAMLHAGMAGEKIGQAAHAAYWLHSYGHEGADYQIKIIRDEFAKLAQAMADLDAALSATVQFAAADEADLEEAPF